MGDYQDTIYGPLPSEWRFIPASQYCSSVTDGTHDSPKPQVVGMPLITSKHIKGRTIDFESAYFISKADYEKINQRSAVHQWDVIISMIGAYCGFTYVESNSEISYAVKNVGMFKTGSRLKALWLDYFLKSSTGQYILDQYKSGSSQPYIALGSLRNLPVLLPSQSEQESIVAILDSLDAKIDLLHRQNKTLEAMAETLFRQWFVERRPGDLEGEAEEGWEEGTVNDLVEIQSGFAFKSKTFAEAGTFRLVTIKAVQDGYLELSNASWLLSAPAAMQPYCKLQLGDILLSLTGNVGRVCLVDEERLLLNQRVAKLHSRNDDNWAFTYVLFRQASFRSLLEETAKGTAQPNLSPIETAQLSIKIPPSQKLMKFDEVATPMLRRVLLNKRSIREITALRDTLLPKLMSGEVRVEMTKN